MVTRVSLHNYTSRIHDDHDDNNHIKNDDNYDIHTNLRSADTYFDSTMDEINPDEIERISGIGREAIVDDSLDRDEGSNTVNCLGERYKDHMQIPSIGVEDDRSSLESSGSLRNSCNELTMKDVLPIETARTRFLQIIVDNFISEHVIVKQGGFIDDTAEPGEDNMNKRKSGEIQYEGDPRFVLPLMYVANLYETLVNEVNLKIASLNGLREKTIGVALEASGGLYRKLTKKFPKSGSAVDQDVSVVVRASSYSFKRRELATSMETRKRFPELVVQEEKRIRFVVANGLSIVDKPTEMPTGDAEWFKRVTGRAEVAINATDYKFYNPRHKVRRASLNASPTVSGLLSYHGSSDHEFQSASEALLLAVLLVLYALFGSSRKGRKWKSVLNVKSFMKMNPGDAITPSKQNLVTVARQPQYQPVLLNHHQSFQHNQSATLISCSHESGQSSHLHDISHVHESPTLSQNMASVEPLAGSHAVDRLHMMPPSPAKFCDECGSPYVRPTSKFCSQCGTKRFGI
ncbi:hypothetical protein KSS87_008612 [Heliosperma pusillum]|nr:hypothetical protein KSS87_008612 [Heliosperma pusillum]